MIKRLIVFLVLLIGFSCSAYSREDVQGDDSQTKELIKKQFALYMDKIESGVRHTFGKDSVDILIRKPKVDLYFTFKVAASCSGGGSWALYDYVFLWDRDKVVLHKSSKSGIAWQLPDEFEQDGINKKLMRVVK